ncbi:MAG: hypothetical protein WCK67_12285 [bacterium]
MSTSRKLTVSELSQALGVSVNTTWKKIKKKGLTTVKDTVNNREITFIELTEHEYDDLMSESSVNIPINNGGYDSNYEDFETIHEGVKVSSSPYEPQVDVISIVERVMDYSKEMNNQVKEYINRVIDAEKQVKLLEDSENRKNDEYHRLIAENKELISKVALLEKENAEFKEKLEKYEAKWWNKVIK